MSLISGVLGRAWIVDHHMSCLQVHAGGGGGQSSFPEPMGDAAVAAPREMEIWQQIAA